MRLKSAKIIIVCCSQFYFAHSSNDCSPSFGYLMTNFHKCVQINTFLDKVYSMLNLWHQTPSPISCPRKASLGRSLHLAVYPISVPIPILLLHHSPRNAPVIVCSSFSFTQSLPPSIFHPRQLPSFNSCLRLQLGEHITSLTGSVGETQAGFILSFFPQCHLCSPIHLSIVLLLLSSFPFSTLPFCFASPISVLTSLLRSYFVTDVILPFLSFPPVTAGPLALIITALNIPPTVHLFLTFPPRIKEWNGRFLPSFSSFFTPHALFLVLRGGDATTYSLRLIIPTGSLQHPDQKEGGEFLWLSSSCDVSGNSERLTVGDLCLSAHGARETEEERQLQWGVVFQAFLAVF